MRLGNSFTLILFSTIFSAIICTYLIPKPIEYKIEPEKYPIGWHMINSKYGKARIRVRSGWLYASGGKQRFIYVQDN